MYKNASKTLSNKRMHSKAAQHQMTVKRINASAKKVGSMLQIVDKISRDVPLLPATEDKPFHGQDTEDVMASSSALITTGDGNTQIMVLSADAKSSRPVRELDRERIERLMSKVADAEKSSGADMDDLSTIGRMIQNAPKRKAPIKRMVSTAEHNESILEKKLCSAISTTIGGKKEEVAQVELTTRQLLPFYKLEDVQHFLGIFQRVDEDYSGDLDIDEWCNFFRALDKNVSVKQARTIFNRINVSGNGILTVDDLLPVVFNNATKAMMGLITKYVERELSRRKKRGEDFLTDLDLSALFDYYDMNALGFVSAGFLRDKIRSLNIPDASFFSLMDKLHEVGDDEMVNEHFFVRMFREFCM